MLTICIFLSDMEKEIKEIPFGAKDSELHKWEYTIPEGFEAEIKDGKVIVKKESEDEKIRKELIEYLTHRAEVTGFIDEDKDCKRWIAYLEKQKESQPLMCDGEIEDKKRDIVAAIRKYYPADYAEYLTSFLKGLSPEDNSEDEYGQEMLGIAYKLMYEHIPENLRTQEFWDSLKFMREYTGKVAIIHPYEQQPAKQLGGTFTSYDMAKTFTEGQNYVIAHPEKFGLCKPAEWGEEDAGMLNCIIATLCEESHGGREANEKMVTWLENRLKSLHPQSHWKPNKKQMDWLGQAILNNSNATMKNALRSLYNDLFKL